MTDAILVVGPSWVGDMVMAQSMLMRLRQRFPKAAIDVLAPGWSLPVIGRMSEVRAGLESPFAHGEFNLAGRRRLGRSFRPRRYDQAIVLPNSWKSALVPFFAEIPRRTGYKREFRYGALNDLRPLDYTLLPRTVQQYVALAEEAPPTATPTVRPPRLTVDVDRGRALKETLCIPEGRMVGLMPGAEYGPAKQWPAYYFGELAKALAIQGIATLIFGSAQERPLGEAITYASAGAAFSLCGKTTLVDVIDLLGQCEAAVTNDSGLMHIAAAVDIPVVAIYGSSSPEHTPPLSAKAKVLYRGLSCSPCFERTCPLKHMNCLREISPAMVLENLEEVLTRET